MGHGVGEEEEGQRGCRGMGMGRGLRRGRELLEEDQKEAHREAGEDQVAVADLAAAAGPVGEDPGVGEGQKAAQAVRGEAEGAEEARNWCYWADHWLEPLSNGLA